MRGIALGGLVEERLSDRSNPATPRRSAVGAWMVVAARRQVLRETVCCFAHPAAASFMVRAFHRLAVACRRCRCRCGGGGMGDRHEVGEVVDGRSAHRTSGRPQ